MATPVGAVGLEEGQPDWDNAPSSITISMPEESPLGVTARSGSCTKQDCCDFTAHNPHNSHHNPGRTNGEAVVDCKKNQPEIRVTAQLWEDRWWGWDRIGKKGDVTRHNKKKVKANGNDKCRNNKHRLTGNSWITFSNRKVSKGEVISKTVKISCG
ncbi:hypothetical protein [Streptomyces alkaliterrae]|uniref:Uncharacterized protein n=1 Tax=Streptomyces alkaliterrae TaxID=2213162 RepID=A0A5P0YWU1_9ACTN|nr:hypothetical protein [Streptomyces alkaliterrae]MBB1255466.1 hypothetical protein [Streptomyces alkaliterrae]MBB1260721.1 hypothetical protein [Streptomyces alkaliterrae]MQS03962.1 hypothetical protein [Streptomyces alkaliterrae]